MNSATHRPKAVQAQHESAAKPVTEKPAQLFDYQVSAQVSHARERVMKKIEEIAGLEERGNGQVSMADMAFIMGDGKEVLEEKARLIRIIREGIRD